MRNKYVLSIALLFVLFASFFPSKILATSWAYPFVVWDGYIYVISDEYVTEIGNEIGQVTRYSDMEQFSGNFSNAFNEGTKYYSIAGMNTEEAIAIEELGDRYIKAYRKGEYKFGSASDGFFDGEQGNFKISIFLILGIFAVILIYKAIKNNRGKR